MGSFEKVALHRAALRPASRSATRLIPVSDALFQQILAAWSRHRGRQPLFADC